MLRFIIKRIFTAIALMVVILTLTFFLVRWAPGGPFDRERKMSAQAMENMHRRYGLDKPLGTQYLLYMSRLLRGDLGESSPATGCRD